MAPQAAARDKPSGVSLAVWTKRSSDASIAGEALAKACLAASAREISREFSQTVSMAGERATEVQPSTDWADNICFCARLREACLLRALVHTSVERDDPATTAPGQRKICPLLFQTRATSACPSLRKRYDTPLLV